MRSQEIGTKHPAVLVSKESKELDSRLWTCIGTRDENYISNDLSTRRPDGPSFWIE